MLLTVAEYQDRVQHGMHELVDQLQSLTGRSGDEEREAWIASLPTLADMLADPALRDAHIYFRGTGNIALEYQLPAASSWCDAVLLGRKKDRELR